MKKRRKQYILFGIVLLAGLFLGFCSLRIGLSYLNNLVFSERQNQLQEVVQQYFDKVDLVTENSWQKALEIKERFVDDNLTDTECVQKFLKTELKVQHMEEEGSQPIAISNDGSYIDENGWHGTLGYIEPLIDCGERVSYIYEIPFTGKLFNLYVYKLELPVEVTDGNRICSVGFVGLSREMESMNQYFKCSAYGGDNSTYILDRYGAKQYVDESANVNLLKGQNVYTVLRKESEAEGKNFDEILIELDKNRVVYSDIQISGEQCFYAMRKMADSDYVIVYVNPTDRVAMSTQTLVNLVIEVLLAAMVAISSVIIGFFIFATIQSQRKLRMEEEAKEKLMKLNGELDKANEELKSSMEATQSAFAMAREASRSKSTFLANMSHDIRTPMNAIIGVTTLIEHNVNSSDKVLEYVDKIRLSGNHLLGLINEVLDMSKIESGKTELDTAVFNMEDILSQIDTAFKTQTDEKKQKFTVNIPAFQFPWIMGDSIRLTQVLNNIVSNAVKYTPVGGKINVDVEEIPRDSHKFNKFIFRIIDNGIGMSKEYQKHIFESFTREESSVTNKIQGTGLGMAIVKSLIDLMGGTIRVYSEQGKGSTFEVELEFKIAKAPIETEKNKQADMAMEEYALNGKKFLCAEDNELNAEILQDLLDMNGASCVICSNGKELVDRFASVKSGEFDAILTDIQMPVMNGFEATEAIRKSENPLGRTIPIIAMTANAFSSDVQKCLESGMDAHIPKPIDMDVLKKTLHVIASGGGKRKLLMNRNVL